MVSKSPRSDADIENEESKGGEETSKTDYIASANRKLQIQMDER